MDLTGYVTINGTDIWTKCGCFLAETSADAHANMDALLRMPKAKEVTTVDFRERDGVELPEDPDIRLSGIERTLQFWLAADTPDGRLQRYRQMLSLLVSGKLSVAVRGYRTYRMVYRDMPSDPEWVDGRGGRRFGVLFSVKFLDYDPSEHRLNTI